MLKFIKSTAMKIIIAVLIVATAGFCYAFPHKVKTAGKIVKSFYLVYKGDKEYSKHNHIGAINNYHAALVLYPGHAKAAYNLANIYAVYEDYASALNYYEQALQYHPSFMNARITMGLLLAEKFFEYDRAIKEYKTAIDKAPIPVNIPFIYNNTGYLIDNKAIAYYNMGLAHKWKSLIYGQDPLSIRISLQESVKANKSATEINKEFYDAYFNMALGHHLLGEQDSAKRWYCRCINMRPFDYDVHYNLAILLREQHNYLDAILELEKAALIVDSDGDGFKTRYIYDVLSETSKKLYAQEDYAVLKERLDKDPMRGYHPTFINGKIVASEELDKAILKNMKTCDACKEY